MDLDLFDIDITVGTPAVPLDGSNGFFCSEDELLSEMDRFRIKQGVIRHVAGKEYSHSFGNSELEKFSSERLHKCMTLLPHHTGEVESGVRLINELADRNIRFVTLYPHSHHYNLSSHICGRLLQALAEAGIILLIEKNEVDYESIYDICSHIPELNVIILGAAYRQCRTLYPMFEYVDNVSVALSRFCGKEFIEDVVDKFGPERLIFSGSMPVYNPAAPLMSLVHADVSDDVKEMIAGGNILSMLGEIDES